MKTDISEFSYGFAITKELVDWYGKRLTAAPLFPSLIEEGKVGYDVKLDTSGFPIFLQFKVSKFIKNNNAKEARQKVLYPPFYRMNLHSRRYSNQHELLLNLENSRELVYYVAPCFHLQQDFNKYYRNQTVALKSVFIKPRLIGAINDFDNHCVSFKPDLSQAYRFSTPIQIEQPIDFTIFTSEVMNFSEVRQASLRVNLQQSIRAIIEVLQGSISTFFNEQIQFSYNLLLQSLESYQFGYTSNLLQEIDILARVFFGCQIFIVSE